MIIIKKGIKKELKVNFEDDDRVEVIKIG